MREIKFEYGFTNHAPVVLTLVEIEDLILLNDELGDVKYRRQFTGLQDKNGVDIYEGDVIEFSDKWEWYRGKYAFPLMAHYGTSKHDELLEEYNSEKMERRVVKYDIKEGYNFSASDCHIWEVIGNIYANPELLEDES